MKPTDIVEFFLVAVEENSFGKAEEMVTPDFEATGYKSDPIDIKEFLKIFRALTTGLSNFRLNYEVMKEISGNVDVTTEILGRHTKDMPSLLNGMQPIPATDLPVRLPVEHIHFTVRDQQIAKLHLQHAPGGGIQGLLKQLGVDSTA